MLGVTEPSEQFSIFYDVFVLHLNITLPFVKTEIENNLSWYTEKRSGLAYRPRDIYNFIPKA